MAARSYEHESRDQQAFQRFLDWLSEGKDSGGEKYLEMHARLVSYFDRKNCTSPLDLADETLSRVARRLEEEGSLTGPSPARYCYIVARFVFLEHQRQARAAEIDVSLLSIQSEQKDTAAEEANLLRLERCLARLDPDQWSLILEYYRGEGGDKIDGRRKLAKRMGLTMNALSIRACRIRDRLQECVRSEGEVERDDVFSRFRLK